MWTRFRGFLVRRLGKVGAATAWTAAFIAVSLLGGIAAWATRGWIDGHVVEPMANRFMQARSETPHLPFGSHEVVTPFGEAGARSRDQWYAALVDQQGTRFCVIATADDRVFATEDHFILQLTPRGTRQPFLRLQTFFDSTRVEDRRPTDLERAQGIIRLSDSLFVRLPGVRLLTVEIQMSRGTELLLTSAYASLDGFHALRPLLQRPECAL